MSVPGTPMSLVYLVRHAQASFGAKDYDRLSELGRQQARWLGGYFAERGLRFARVLSGTLARQQDTARELLARVPGGDAGVVRRPARRGARELGRVRRTRARRARRGRARHLARRRGA